jgi:hypothetical protein
MANYETHLLLISQHENTLQHLINANDGHGITIAAYYKSLHIIDALAARESDRHFDHHKNRLDYLEEKRLGTVKDRFDKLYVLSMFAQYGEQENVNLLRSLTDFFNQNDCIDALRSWVNIISRISQE